MKYIILIAAALLLVACQNGPQTVVENSGEMPKTRTSGDPYAECDGMEQKVAEHANSARSDEGLNQLYCDRELAKIAQAHAEDMCQNNYLSHTSQDGRTMQDRADNRSVDYMALGENVAMGQRSADQVHANWMDSPGHRKNLLHDMFSRIGVGYAPCGGQPYWVQVFAN